MEIYIQHHRKQRENYIKKVYSKLNLVKSKEQDKRYKEMNRNHKFSKRIKNFHLSNSIIKIINHPAFLLQHQMRAQKTFKSCNQQKSKTFFKQWKENSVISQKRHRQKNQSNNIPQFQNHCKNATIKYLRDIVAQKQSSKQKIKIKPINYTPTSCFDENQTPERYLPSYQLCRKQIYSKLSRQSNFEMHKTQVQNQTPSLKGRSSLDEQNINQNRNQKIIQLKNNMLRISSAAKLKRRNKYSLSQLRQKFEQTNFIDQQGWQVEAIEDIFII